MNLVLLEREDIVNAINLNIHNIKQNNNQNISSTISLNEKLYKSKKYINVYNFSDSLINEIELKTDVRDEVNYNLSINDTGILKIEILAKLDSLIFKSNKEYVVIEDYNIENQFLYQNKKSIFNFINNNSNNISYFNFSNIDSGINIIKLNELVYTKQNNLGALSTQYLWVVFIFLLSVEWYLRKKSKLL